MRTLLSLLALPSIALATPGEPLPIVLTAEPGPSWLGEDMWVTVTGATPGEMVMLVKATGAGAGRCPTIAGAQCLWLTTDLALVGQALSVRGGASFLVPLPDLDSLDNSLMCFQAVAVRGAGGANSVGSAPVCVVPRRRPDADGDGVPDTLDVCPGYDDTVDLDLDGIPDGCDPECEFGSRTALTESVCATSYPDMVPYSEYSLGDSGACGGSGSTSGFGYTGLGAYEEAGFQIPSAGAFSAGAQLTIGFTGWASGPTGFAAVDMAVSDDNATWVPFGTLPMREYLGNTTRAEFTGTVPFAASSLYIRFSTATPANALIFVTGFDAQLRGVCP